jgi:fructokinase
MNNILCIGEALIDMICTDKGKPLSEGEHFLKKAGGAPTNVAAAICALGGKALLAAKVGVDPFGTHLVEVMQSFGVDTRYVYRSAQHFTTFAFVSLMQNGERDFYFNRGADGELTPDDIDSIDLSACSIAHFGSATAFLPGPLQHSYRLLLDACLAKGIFISFDPNYRHLLFSGNTESFVSQSWQYLRHCHFFKVSDEEAMLLTGKPSVEEAAAELQRQTTAVFAITLGKDGTLLGINGSMRIIPSIPVNPVDTTGAGDAFVGALLYQLSNLGVPAMQALSAERWAALVANANKAGARTCQYLGAMEAFRHLNNDIFK